jgi:hypothetical protein
MFTLHFLLTSKGSVSQLTRSAFNTAPYQPISGRTGYPSAALIGLKTVFANRLVVRQMATPRPGTNALINYIQHELVVRFHTSPRQPELGL